MTNNSEDIDDHPGGRQKTQEKCLTKSRLLLQVENC